MNLVKTLSFILFFSYRRVMKKRSNCLIIVWILLKARHLNNFENSFNKPCKYGFLSILDDKVIGSWHLNILNIQLNYILLY